MIFGRSMTFDREGLTNTASAAYDQFAVGAEGEDLLAKLKAGDPRAFDNLVDRYSSEIYTVLYRITNDPEEAADLTQETFLSALKGIKNFRGDSELKTWLYRIAVNHSRNRFRWWKRRRFEKTVSFDDPSSNGIGTIGDTIADDSHSAEDHVLNIERETALKQALASLPSAYREAVILCDIEGLSYDEIARILGANIGTVKSRISRGREELRKTLSGI